MSDTMKLPCQKVGGHVRSHLPPMLATAALQLVRTVCERSLESDYAGAADSRAGASTAMLLAATSVALQEPSYRRGALDLMDRALVGLDITNHALFGGATGVIWSALEVDTHLGIDEYRAIADDYDEALFERLSSRGRWHGHFDLIGGLAGIGAYALSRRASGTRGPLLELVLEHLRSMATSDEQGCRWVTTRSMSPNGGNWSAPDSDILADLGMAHGNAGVIALLSAAHWQRDVTFDSQSLLVPAVSWYLAQQRGEPSDGAFGYRAGETGASRGAWCYGDFSAAWALSTAGQALKDERLSQFALHLLRQATTRSSDALQLHDPWLCHGYAGLAHVTRRAADMHGDAELHAVAQRYFAESLQLVSHVMQRPDLPWSLLEGVTGNCLCYLDACGLIKRGWDRPLLIF